MRPSASQIVSVASAPEFPHLIDVVSLSHESNLLAVPGSGDNFNGKSFLSATSTVEEFVSFVTDNSAFEIWLANSNHRVELLSSCNDRWLNHQRITNHQSSIRASKFTTICTVGNAIWIGDSNAIIHSYW